MAAHVLGQSGVSWGPIGRADPHLVADGEARRGIDFSQGAPTRGGRGIGGSPRGSLIRSVAFEPGLDLLGGDDTTFDQHALCVADPLLEIRGRTIGGGHLAFDAVAERVGVESRRPLGELGDGEGPSLPIGVEQHIIAHGDRSETGAATQIVHRDRVCTVYDCTVHVCTVYVCTVYVCTVYVCTVENTVCAHVCHPGRVHPASTALFLIGYGFSLPVLLRIVTVLRSGNRLALYGHQVGMLMAGLGWLLRGQVGVAGLHLVWMIAVRLLSLRMGTER